MTIHEAIERGDIEKVVELLNAGADVNASMPAPAELRAFSRDEIQPGSAPLHLAARHGHTEIAEMLLSRAADVHAIDAEGRTPLHIAAFWGRTDVAAILLVNGANIDALDAMGVTPLYETTFGKGGASGSGPDRLNVAKLLLWEGADVNARQSFALAPGASTPLHNAAKFGEIELIRLLLDAGADVDIKNKLPWVDMKHQSGLTALHCAAWYGRTAVVELLLDMGASVNATNDARQTPLDVAMACDRSETADLLRRRGGLESARPWWAFWR